MQRSLTLTQSTGSRPRVIDSISGKSFTGPQIAKYIRQFAWGLHQRGVNQNDVVAVLSPNTMWYPVMVFGAVAANAIVTTLNPTYTPDEVAFQLKDSGASVLFFSPLLEDTVKAALKSLPGMRRVVAIGSPEFDAIVNGPEVHQIRNSLFCVSVDLSANCASVSLCDLTDRYSLRVCHCSQRVPSQGVLPKRRVNPSRDLCLLPYSSGTTGLAKGVMLSHVRLPRILLRTSLDRVTHARHAAQRHRERHPGVRHERHEGRPRCH